MTETQKQVTVGFKVSVDQKKEIEAAARRLGVDVSTYLREILMGQHSKVKRFTAVPDALVIDQEYIPTMTEQLKRLWSKHSSHTVSEIIHAALALALENEDRVVSNKIKKYLK